MSHNNLHTKQDRIDYQRRRKEMELGLRKMSVKEQLDFIVNYGFRAQKFRKEILATAAMQMKKSPRAPLLREVPAAINASAFRLEHSSPLVSPKDLVRKIEFSPETAHFLDILVLHYGVPRQKVVDIAVTQLFKEAGTQINKDRMILYEERLAMLYISRLMNAERKMDIFDDTSVRDIADDMKETEHKPNVEAAVKTYSYYPPGHKESDEVEPEEETEEAEET